MAEADPKIETPAAVALSPAFAVKLDSFLRVKPFVSTEESRYYLNGVHVQPCKAGGALCVATDGHRLGARRDPLGVSYRPVIVRVPAEFKLPRKSLLPEMPWVVCMEANGRGHISLVEPRRLKSEDTAEAAIDNVDECLMRFGRAVIDGTFPDWARVVPKPVEGKTISFNGDYMKSFGRICGLNGAGPADPHLIMDSDDREFVGVLMPVCFNGDKRVPAWLAA